MKNLFGEEVGTPRQTRTRTPGTRTQKAKTGLGCPACSMNEVEGVNKVINIDRVKGKRIFIWAQCPGAKENKQELELVGNAGQFLWSELAVVGITRAMCDVQNVVRCQPTITDDGNTPDKKMLKCCSIYNEQAIDANKGNAVIHLILGKIAGQQLLGPKYGKAKQHAYWHPTWNAYVIVADHPSRILRAGGKKSGWLYRTFTDKLKAVKAILDHPGRWGYVNAQDYGPVTTPAEMSSLKQELLAYAAAGNRISVDIEDDDVNGKRVVLTIAFGWRNEKGWLARSVVLYHPEADQSPKRIRPILADLRELLEDPKVKKVFQHGSYDVEQTAAMLGASIKGYNFDTQYASYLWLPFLRTYGLDSLVGYFHMEFADYKAMVEGHSGNFAKVPLKTLVTYNCADADLTKRVEDTVKAHISFPLLQVYIHCAFTLGWMEKRGPILDREAHTKVMKYIHPRVEELARNLQRISGDPDFNPNTPQRIAKLLFDKLKLPKIAGRSTAKDVLTELSATTKSKVPGLVAEYRGVHIMESTFLTAFKRSADLHDGELRTIWWLTGAATGRLRSGKSDKASVEEGILNFQNLHGNPLLKNLLVSDRNWRIAL